MSTTGFLSDLSLLEIFQFIDKGHKTGLLTLRALPESESLLTLPYYIWVDKGCIVAAANRLDQQGLVSLIKQFHMVSDRVFDKLVHLYCPIDKPLGLYLKNQGLLKAYQLKHLFQIQVLQPVFTLFQLNEGQFKFDPHTQPPASEMTGWSVPIMALNRYSWVQLLLQEIDNYCLNLKALPSNHLDEVPLDSLDSYFSSSSITPKPVPKKFGTEHSSKI
jgi:hypothetical protein